MDNNIALQFLVGGCLGFVVFIAGVIYFAYAERDQ